jgi:hypothetical protein
VAQAENVRINVQADQVIHPISRLLTGACIEDVNHEIYSGLYSQMVFGESFQEPAPPPSITGFTSYGGRWVVQHGVAQISGADGPKLVSDRSGFKDGVAGVELLFADRTDGNAGVIVRTSTPGAGADAFTGYEVSLDPARQMLRLARHRGNYDPISDVPCEVPVGKWISLEVKLAGPVVEILVDGKTVLRHDDGPNALSAGDVGLRVWQREASFRNLWVNTAGAVEPLPFEQSEDSPEISGMWREVKRSEAKGSFAITNDEPFLGTQSQQMAFESGGGEVGVENQGLNRWGMSYVAGKAYTGCVWARAGKPTTLFAALESRDGSKVYAETPLTVAAHGWQRIAFTLKPGASDKAGCFTLKLKQPGSVTLGYAFLEPGKWGRFKGLPVRRDVAEALIRQGITVLRYGGSMVNCSGYRWKKMIGPADRRPPYSGLWYPYSTNGWGIPDFMNFCEAAGFEYIPTFNLDETPQDMADFIEYAMGPADSEWGRKRVADGHPTPYKLKYMELGNEERVDDSYFARFEALADSIWAKAPDVTLVVGDFVYSKHIQDPFRFDGAASGITSLAAQQKILHLAKQHGREVWFDLHVGTDGPTPDSTLDGMFSYIDALERIADGARFKVAVFELNAGNHAQKRALANAIALNDIERDGRLAVVTSANGLQPDGQNDNGWDQGLLFLNPSQVWLQPPGYVTQMLSRNYQPQLVQCEVTPPGNSLNVNATRSEDGKTLVLQVVNPTAKEVTAEVFMGGFVPRKPSAEVTELSANLEAVNTAADPQTVAPKRSRWKHGIEDGKAVRSFPPYSFTLLRFE